MAERLNANDIAHLQNLVDETISQYAPEIELI